MSQSLNNCVGECLCGSVKVTVAELKPQMGACHCSTCRTWSGGPFLSLDAGTDVTFVGSSSVKAYDSSDWAQRGFCEDCGTHLFYRLKATGQHFMPAGLFAQLNDLDFDHQIFVDEKPSYYDFANQTKNMTGAEVFAQFAAKS